MTDRACPDCGVQLVRPADLLGRGDYPSDGPLNAATPFLRLSALAASTGVDVFNVSEKQSSGLAGALGVALDPAFQLRGTIGLAKGLDEELRTDVLAFALAIYTAEAGEVARTRHGSVGICRDRKPHAKRGVGHLAWHMLYNSGRETDSATFEVVVI